MKNIHYRFGGNVDDAGVDFRQHVKCNNSHNNVYTTNGDILLEPFLSFILRLIH